jgi:hypothetical protein
MNKRDSFSCYTGKAKLPIVGEIKGIDT